MRLRALALGFIPSSLVGCAAILGIDDGTPRDGGSDVFVDGFTDAKPETSPACDLSKPFKAPVALTSLNTSGTESQARLLADERTIYFQRSVVDAGYDLFFATRPDTTTAFGSAAAVTELNTPSNDSDLSVSPDGLRAFFASDRAGGLGGYDLWQATRDGGTVPFGALALTPNLSSTQDDFESYYVPGALYFASSRGANGVDLYRAAELSGGFASPLLIPELASAAFDGLPVVTTDELRFYFASNRGDGGTLVQIWTSSRATSSSPWQTPTVVTELVAGNTAPSWISPDGCRLYLWSDRSGPTALYVASK